MRMTNADYSYGAVSKFLHWTIALLIISLLIVGFLMGGIEDKALKIQVINMHKAVGVTVLALMVFRVLWIVIGKKPKMPGHMHKVTRVLAKGSHFILYFLGLAIPTSGFIMSSAAGYHVKYFGLTEFMLPLPKNKELASMMNSLHECFAWAIIAFLALHIFAALFHHFVYKDDVLRRMWYHKEN